MKITISLQTAGRREYTVSEMEADSLWSRACEVVAPIGDRVCLTETNGDRHIIRWNAIEDIQFMPDDPAPEKT